MKKLSLIIITSISFFIANAQTKKFYKDFDLFSLSGLSPVDSSELPLNYVVVYANEDATVAIDVVVRERGYTQHMDITKSVFRNVLVLGKGKERDGYTRGSFQKKIYSEDSAVITTPTIFFKHQTNKRITTRRLDRTNDSSFVMRSMAIDLTKENRKSLQKFFKNSNYDSWGSLDSPASFIRSAKIELKEDPIVTFGQQKPVTCLIRVPVKRKDFKEQVPRSVFWLYVLGYLGW